nr:hypothetical transcript [Hymenolepis microstoma]
MMTRRYRQELLSTSILDPPTGDCSSIASSCSPCPGAIASYPSLLATSALSSPILSTPSDPSSILLQFAEGTSPKLPDDVDPSTPLHVMPSFHEMSPLRRRWRPVKITTKGLAPTSSTTTASLDANGVEEPRAASRLKEEETFHTVEDALQFGMVRLVPCPHLMKAVVDPEKSPMYGRGHGQLDKVHYASRKTFDLGPVSKLSHHPSQLSSNSHTHLHNQSTMGTTVTAGSGGGSVSSFLSSGLRAVTSGFVRPRERRRSVSTPCGNEAPGNANNEGGCGNTVTNIPSSSTPGSARASDFAHSICALPGSGTSHLTAAGYSTDTASKASTPPYVTDEVDGLCAANDGSGLNPESPLPCLQVSSVSEMMEIANISNRRTYPYTPNQEKNCNNSAETVTPSVSGCQPRHWHLPTCPHRLCIPRQNLPPPPSLIRRHANNNFSSTGSHVSIINSSTQLEDHLSFRNSYYQHHNQSESVAAQPPELRHLPVEHPRLHRQQPTTIAPVSLSAFQGDRRSALDLPSYLETTSAAGVVCSTAAATPDNRSTTCLLATNEDKSPNRLMMTRRYRQELLSTSILDPPTGDCSSIASSCSPCPGAIASYPSLLATSALSSPILSTPSDPSSILLQFAEGTSPKLPDDVDPSTPLHVMPSFHEMSPLRRRWRPVKITTKGLAPTSSTTTASLDANGVEEPRAASRLKEEETFHTVEDALQFGMVRLVPCPHLMKAVVDPEKSPMYGRGHGQLDKVHYASRKTFDLGPVSKLSHHPSQLSSNSHTHLHNQSTMGTTVTAGSGGGSVSSFLSSGLRAVTSGFVRPRERRRSVSTPCGNEAPGNANNEGGCGNTVTNIPSSSTPGSARASDFAHSICALPGSGTSHLTAAGYSTDTASKASTPPYVTDEVDGLCAANDGSGLNPESPLPCLQVSSVSEMMEIANISNRRTYPYTPNQEKNCNNSAETVTPSVSGCQPRHWHLPTCPHRLCIPRQNLPPPPSLIRRHANNNFSSTGSHVSIINSSTQLEDHLSFRNSYYQHHNQSESVAAQPPELRHLPVEHPRLHRQQPTTIAPVSLSAFQGDRRSALDLPSYLETTSAAGVVCSTAAATPDNRSTTCLLASSASQRLSPPPTPTSATTSKSLFNTTTTVRKNKRTMLSLFGGRTTTSLSSNHHHHQSNQQVNSHNPANSVGTFATSSGSGGASFPSTPVHESPTSSSIVMATTSLLILLLSPRILLLEALPQFLPQTIATDKREH